MTDIDCAGMSFEQATRVARLLVERNELRAAVQRLTRPEGETEEQVAEWLRGRGYEVSKR